MKLLSSGSLCAPLSRLPVLLLLLAAFPAVAVAASPTEVAPLEAGTDFLASAVRIRIEDGDTFAWGSGTVIESHADHALVLTCGHLYRGVSEAGVTKVDLFVDMQVVRADAIVLGCDLEHDVALLKVPTDSRLPAAPVAAEAVAFKAGDKVISVGCPGGNDPDAFHTEVVSVNKYLGPENIQTRGAPLQGRSGGGLFTARGELIGVCNAADRQFDEGIFASLPVIRRFLSRHKR